jgi:hypothetical protein
VIDTAVSFLPLAQRNRRPLQDALAALNDLTKIPLGVLLINQSRTFRLLAFACSRAYFFLASSRSPALLQEPSHAARVSRSDDV